MNKNEPFACAQEISLNCTNFRYSTVKGFTVCLPIHYRIGVLRFEEIYAINALKGGFDFLVPKVLFMEPGLFFQEWAEAFIDFKDPRHQTTVDRQPVGAWCTVEHASAVAR